MIESRDEMRSCKGIAAGVLVATLVATCGGGRTIAGTITLRSPGNLSALPGEMIKVDGSSCAGSDTWSYIRAGQAVAIRDQQGKALATGTLEAGRGTQTECTLPFRISGIPDRDRYLVAVEGADYFSPLVAGFAASALEAQGWTIDLVCDDGNISGYC